MRKSSPKKVSAKDMLLKDKEYLDTILQTKTFPDISFSATNPLNPDNSRQTRYENPFIQKVRAVRKAKEKEKEKSKFTPTTFEGNSPYNREPGRYLSGSPGWAWRAPILTAEEWVKTHPEPHKDFGDLRSIREEIKEYEPWALEYEKGGGKKKRSKRSKISKGSKRSKRSKRSKK